MPQALSPDEVKRLQAIHDFPALIEYLRDDLEWPLNAEHMEDLTFDYTPEELGLEREHVVKLRNIKQLRPLVTDQPWGIFYLEFERKRLPVVVLRRILRELVPKKRQTANVAERALWNKHDLLFISHMGESSHRRISFAHFRDVETGPPVLQTVDWDDQETQFTAIGASISKLRWPNRSSDVAGWRRDWSNAFTKPHRYAIGKAHELSIELARLAGRTRDRVRAIYSVESKEGPLHKLHEGFKTALVHDLTSDSFSDMVAQTVAYGLFAARAETGKVFGLSNLAEMIPGTNPFLRDLFGEIEKLGDAEGSYINFDELGVTEIVTLLNDADMHGVMEDFGRQTGGGREDPVIHFYEAFLKEYDAKQRVQRGVFYTPKPVVSFIVRSVDKILRDEFGCPDGLADISTWGDMAARNPGLVLPKGVTPEMPFVQILDPATGTGTFLETVIDVIWQTMVEKWRKAGKTRSQIEAAWNEYVPKHLLPRLNGFELMVASYTIAHVKLGLKLKQTGYDFQSGERLRVYLTNTLEEPDELGKQRTMASAFNFLAHESRAADAVKRDAPITVIVGNPPYSISSQNKGGWILILLEDYKRDLNEKKINLDDDFIKFMRFSQWEIQHTGYGILGLITNHTHIDGITHRRMRNSLINSFDKLYILDLHGNSRKQERCLDGSNDENVFEIQQGVAINLFTRTLNASRIATVFHSDLWGLQDAKYRLLQQRDIGDTTWLRLHPASPNFYLVPKDFSMGVGYESMPSLSHDIFTMANAGIQTKKDGFVYNHSEEGIRCIVNDLMHCPLEALTSKYSLSSEGHWSLAAAKADVKNNAGQFVQVLYHPFDTRWTYYTGKTSGFMARPRAPLMRNALKYNLLLLTVRNPRRGNTNSVFVSKIIIDKDSVSPFDNATFFPLYQYLDNGQRLVTFSHEFIEKLESHSGLKLVSGTNVDQQTEHSDNNSDPALLTALGMFEEYHGLFQNSYEPIVNRSISSDKLVTPEDVFYYAYAVFHSPTYRERYAEFLKIDFPRLPLTSDIGLFRTLAALGEQLTALHLMEKTGPNPAAFPTTGNNMVDGAPQYTESGQGANEGRVHINKTQYFAPVPPEVWEFHVGGYQVCQKWLKDRKGRLLSSEDITHYGRIVAALGETIRLMAEIDAVIEEHGGWPLQ